MRGLTSQAYSISRVEPLENRLLFSQMTFTVSNTTDADAGSLRQAILDSNASPMTVNSIVFDLPSGTQTIQPATALPVITSRTIFHGPTDSSGLPTITLDGSVTGAVGLRYARNTPGDTQPGILTNLFIEGCDGPAVTLDGSGLQTIYGCDFLMNQTGVQINSPNNVIGFTRAGFAYTNYFGVSSMDGIHISGGNANNNLVQNSNLGTATFSSNAVLPGNSGNGLLIDNGAANNTIGGVGANQRNLISDNRLDGIKIVGAGPGNVILGNYIGTNSAGNQAAGNSQDGIYIDSDGVRIGRKGAGRNVISGNRYNGIVITGNVSAAAHNIIAGNYIGTAANGKGSIPNAGDGIVLNNTGANLISNNIIAFNGIATPLIVARRAPVITPQLNVQESAGPGHGVDVLGSSTDGVSILGNSIFSNALLGINLGDDNKPTRNDSLDDDFGPNDLQNFPILRSAIRSGSQTKVTGGFNSTPSRTFRVELFSTSPADPKGFGEGTTFLGFVTVKTNRDGDATFTKLLPQVAAGRFLTATATDKSSGDTSEFSRALKVK